MSSSYLSACPHRRWELDESASRNPWAGAEMAWVCGHPQGGGRCNAADPREPEHCPRFARARDTLCPECLADNRAANLIQDREPQAGAGPLLACLRCGASWTPDEHRAAMVATFRDMLADLLHVAREVAKARAREAA